MIKHLIILKIRKYDGWQRGLVSMVCKMFNKKSSGSGSGIKNGNISNRELVEELLGPIIRKFEKKKVHLLFIDSIWGADLANMQLISKFNKEIHFLLYALLIFSVNVHGLFFWKIKKV